jgi:hypothetical protein
MSAAISGYSLDVDAGAATRRTRPARIVISLKLASIHGSGHCRRRSGDRTIGGADNGAQTRQILKSFTVMLEAAGSDLDHITHINIFLKQMSGFEAMNAAYVEIIGDRGPARTAISVQDLPKPGVADDESDGRDAGP